jgi:hypothetical protein
MGSGRQLCKELAAEEEEHVALLESELAQVNGEAAASLTTQGF